MEGAVILRTVCLTPPPGGGGGAERERREGSLNLTTEGTC